MELSWKLCILEAKSPWNWGIYHPIWPSRPVSARSLHWAIIVRMPRAPGRGWIWLVIATSQMTTRIHKVESYQQKLANDFSSCLGVPIPHSLMVMIFSFVGRQPWGIPHVRHPFRLSSIWVCSFFCIGVLMRVVGLVDTRTGLLLAMNSLPRQP